MAYMHKQTFDISPKGDSYMNNADDNYFHVDDLIALPIQILNRKGYLTKGCCAGIHPNLSTLSPNPNDWTSSQCWIIFKDDISLPYLPPGFVKEFYNGDLKSRAKEAKQEKKSLRDKSFVIKHNVPFQHKLLSDCDANGNTIYGIWRETFEGIEKLYKWSLDLPDL